MLEVSLLSPLKRRILNVFFRDAPRGRYLLDLERTLRLPASDFAPDLEALIGADYVKVNISKRGACYHAALFKRYLIPFLGSAD